MSGQPGLSKEDRESGQNSIEVPEQFSPAECVNYSSPESSSATASNLSTSNAPAKLSPEQERQESHSPAAEPVKEASVVVAEAAHELRLPIANIKLLVETLLDGALDEREVCKRMLKRIYQETDRLQALVSDLLALEQVSERRHDLKCEWLPFKERVEYSAESVRKQAQEKSISISIEVSQNQLIFANKGQLDQVLLNLLENAVKFSNTGGKVIVRGSEKHGKFSVEDSGIGMPESEIPKIFSKFYRIEKSASRKGTGLGLSIVRQVVDLHGAKISVKSEEGAGSCFELEFPSPGLR